MSKPHARAPLVSVLVRCYQSGATLQRALASLVIQTFEDFEVVIVDDGSTDETPAIVGNIRDARFRVVRLPTNLGRAAALKVGISVARGELIAVLDADDWWYPSKLESQVGVLNELSSVAFVSANLALVATDGSLQAVEGVRRAAGSLVVFERMSRPGRRRLPHPSSLFRTSAIARAPVDVRLLRCSDLFLAQTLMLRHPCAALTAPLYAYAFPQSVKTYEQCAAASQVVYSRFFCEYPATSVCMQVLSRSKELAYRVSAASGTFGRILAARGLPPSRSEIEAFESAQGAVERALDALVSTPSST